MENRWRHLLLIVLLGALVTALGILYDRSARGRANVDAQYAEKCHAMGGNLVCVDDYGNRYSDLLRPIAGRGP